MDQEYPKRRGVPGAETVLRAENLTREPKFRNISFELKKGEILGIAGLVGAGRTEIVRCIFGADRLDSGALYVRGKPVEIKSVSYTHLDVYKRQGFREQGAGIGCAGRL